MFEGLAIGPTRVFGIDVSLLTQPSRSRVQCCTLTQNRVTTMVMRSVVRNGVREKRALHATESSKTGQQRFPEAVGRVHYLIEGLNCTQANVTPWKSLLNCKTGVPEEQSNAEKIDRRGERRLLWQWK
jgi:hypothetical protein